VRLALLLVFLALPFAAVAQPADLYPPLVTGTVQITAEMGAYQEGVVDAASLAIVQMNAASGAVNLVCASDVTPGQVGAFSEVAVEAPGDGSPAILKARAFTAPDCTGDFYADSLNSAHVVFGAPAEPMLIPFGSKPPDVTVP